jgi:hypothetical protein
MSTEKERYDYVAHHEVFQTAWDIVSEQLLNHPVSEADDICSFRVVGTEGGIACECFLGVGVLAIVGDGPDTNSPIYVMAYGCGEPDSAYRRACVTWLKRRALKLESEIRIRHQLQGN